MKKFLAAILTGILPAFILIVSIQSSHGGSATWKANPGSGDWNTAANWTPMTVPNGPGDTATFAASNTTGLSLSGNLDAEVNGIVFDPGASAFTIATGHSGLIFSGVGITNNSGINQNFVTRFGAFTFTNSATAGTRTTFTYNGGKSFFTGNSTAGSGTFILNSTKRGQGAAIRFSGNTTAGNGTFIINGGTVSNSFGGTTTFSARSNAGDATLIANGGANGAAGPPYCFWLNPMRLTPLLSRTAPTSARDRAELVFWVNPMAPRHE